MNEKEKKAVRADVKRSILYYFETTNIKDLTEEQIFEAKNEMQKRLKIFQKIKGEINSAINKSYESFFQKMESGERTLQNWDELVELFRDYGLAYNAWKKVHKYVSGADSTIFDIVISRTFSGGKLEAARVELKNAQENLTNKRKIYTDLFDEIVKTFAREIGWRKNMFDVLDDIKNQIQNPSYYISNIDIKTVSYVKQLKEPNSQNSRFTIDFHYHHEKYYRRNNDGPFEKNLDSKIFFTVLREYLRKPKVIICDGDYRYNHNWWEKDIHNEFYRCFNQFAKDAKKFQKTRRLKTQAAVNKKTQRGLASSFRSQKQFKMQLQLKDTCPYCNNDFLTNNLTEKIHLDHIYPVSKGGHSVPENLVFICETCNKNKADQTLHKFCLKMDYNSNNICEILLRLGKDI